MKDSPWLYSHSIFVDDRMPFSSAFMVHRRTYLNHEDDFYLEMCMSYARIQGSR